jgi:hypothetical protein
MPAWSPVRWLAALAVVPLLLFGPLLAAGEVFLPYLPAALEPLASEDPVAAAEAAREANWTMGDRIFPFLTDQISARRELLAGHLPTWEPRQSLGMPLIGGQITGLTYPPNLLGLLLPPERAAAPLAMLSLWLAGLGLALFLTRLGLDPRAVLIGALAYQLGGWGLANLFYYMKVDSALWLPWALWAVDGWRLRRRGSAFALVAALGLSALGAMVTVTAFVLATTVVYAAVRIVSERQDWKARGRTALALGLLTALGVAAGATQLLPLADAGRASLRTEMTRSGVVELGLPLATTLGVVVPDLAGPPSDASARPGRSPLAFLLTPGGEPRRAELANALEWNTFALCSAALLALVALVATPRRAALPAALLLLSFAFAQAWPPLRPLYGLPGLGLGAPGRVLAISWALWPWLAALGVQALLERAPRALATWLSGALAVTALSFAAWRGLEPAAFPERLVALFSERFGFPPETVRAEFSPASLVVAGEHLRGALGRTVAVGLGLCLAGLAALFLDRSRPGFEGGAGPLAIASACLGSGCGVALVLALGSGVTGAGGLLTLGAAALLALAAAALRGEGASREARASLPTWLPLLTVLLLEGFLNAGVHVRGRSVLTDDPFPPSPAIAAVAQAAGDARVLRLDPDPGLANSARLARPNLLVPYGIAELTPYASLAPAEPVELLRALDPRMESRNYAVSLPALELVDRPVLDLLRVGALLSTAPVEHERLEPLLERPGFCVYRRTGALPPARLVPRARTAPDDESILAALTAPEAAFDAWTWIAPEDADGLPEDTDDHEEPPATDAWSPGEVTVERPAANHVRVRVQDSSGGWLVLHDQWSPDWVATLDGAPLRVRRADHACRAVPVPAGSCTVDFQHEPRALRNGLWLTLTALLGTLAWELLNRRTPA